MRERVALMRVWALLFFFLLPSHLCAEPSDLIELKDSLFSIDFVDSQSGWAVGYYGCVLHTNDGGKTWSFQDSGTKKLLASIDFVDALHGWAVGYGPTILHTGDGGKTWIAQETGEDIFYLTGVHFLDTAKGWAVGDWGTILHTDDGGMSWKAQFSGDDAVLYDIDFADDMHGWAVGEFGTVFYTQDGGQNWTKQVSGVENVFFSCEALDPLNVWLAGIDSIVLRTRDGGASWERVDTGITKVLPFYDIAFCGNQTAIICGQGLTLYSADSGITWRAANFEADLKYIWLHGIRSTPGVVWMVGEKGRVFRSSSAGKHWEEITY